VSLVADPAFLLEPDAGAVAFGARLRQTHGALVGISISQGIASWTGVDPSVRMAAWERVLHRMVHDFNAHVLLIPHVQETFADDAESCHELWKRLGYSPAVSVLAGDFSAAEYKGVLSQCDLVIAERMHAGIGAISSGVPTALVAYSVKARGILEAMIGPELCEGNALIEGNLFASPDAVVHQLDQVWHQRRLIADALAASVPNAQNMARKSFEPIAACLGSV
jgi:colanic acid/amylovoran biosynthesis protein